MKKVLMIFCALLLILCGCGCEQIGFLLSDPSDAQSSWEETSSAVSQSSAGTVSTPSSKSSSVPVSSTVSPAVSSKTSSQTSSQLPRTVTITIPEGYSMTQIFLLLEKKHVSTFDKLLSTAQTYDYTYYPLIAEIQKNSSRCFTLEGYLFPDTYEFYTNQKPENAIGVFLRNAEKKLTDQLRSRAAALGYSVDEILTIASIIEKECGKASEMKNVSAILHNRLKSGMKLQCDATINYVERYLKPYLEGDINRYNSFYNTYKCSALPAGPICNPGTRAIEAALSPADSDALYFVTDSDGNYYYAADYETHKQNCLAVGIELD